MDFFTLIQSVGFENLSTYLGSRCNTRARHGPIFIFHDSFSVYLGTTIQGVTRTLRDQCLFEAIRPEICLFDRSDNK